MSQQPLIIQVTSGGRTIGRITPDQFAKALGYNPRREFLAAAVERFNQAKAAAGEPERCSIELNPHYRPAPEDPE